jgi:hypothetical protein
MGEAKGGERRDRDRKAYIVKLSGTDIDMELF